MTSLVLREYLTLLHPPTTSCILAFAIIGSMSAPVINLDRLLLILLQLFLIGGVAAGYFDEIKGRPWHTKMHESHLWTIGFSALAASSLIGLYLALTIAGWFWLFVTVWAFFTIAYDLELFNGRFHNTSSLALSGGSVHLGSYYLQSLTITPQILLLSLVTSLITGYGRNLYEMAKPVCKDKKPSPHKREQRAWALLKTQILFMNIFAVVMLAYRLLA